MYQIPDSRSLIRPSWIKDLAAALSDAERMLAALEADGRFPAETIQLRIRVDTIRSEMELLDRVTRNGDRVVRAPWPDPTPIHVGNI